MTAEVLPLFPLNTVLFPGVPLPLHVFEERYRILLGELVEGPAPRRFGVVAIRHGLEVGEALGRDELHDVGCVAELRRVDQYADGRYDVGRSAVRASGSATWTTRGRTCAGP